MTCCATSPGEASFPEPKSCADAVFPICSGSICGCRCPSGLPKVLILITADCSCLHLPDALSVSPDLEVAFCPRAVSPVSILLNKVLSASLLESRVDSWSVSKAVLFKACLFPCSRISANSLSVPSCRTLPHPPRSLWAMGMSLDQGYNTVLSIVEMSIQKLSANL